jgi:hypothetical protein
VTGESPPAAGLWLKTKNDENRFGLTRAPLPRRGRLERGQSHRLSSRRTKRIKCSFSLNANHIALQLFAPNHFFGVFIAGTAEVNCTRTLPHEGSAVISAGILRWSLVR